MSNWSTTLSEQPEVFIAADARRFEVRPNDEYRHLTIRRNHYRSRHAFFDVRTMAAFLPNEVESRSNEHALELFPVHRRQFRHRRLRSNGRGAMLNGNPVRPFPLVFTTCVSGFFQHLIESARIGRSAEKQLNSFVDGGARCVSCSAGTRHVQRHRVSDVLVAFLPNVDGVVDLHCNNSVTGEAPLKTFRAEAPRTPCSR